MNIYQVPCIPYEYRPYNVWDVVFEQRQNQIEFLVKKHGYPEHAHLFKHPLQVQKLIKGASIEAALAPFSEVDREALQKEFRFSAKDAARFTSFDQIEVLYYGADLETALKFKNSIAPRENQLAHFNIEAVRSGVLPKDAFKVFSYQHLFSVQQGFPGADVGLIKFDCSGYNLNFVPVIADRITAYRDGVRVREVKDAIEFELDTQLKALKFGLSIKDAIQIKLYTQLAALEFGLPIDQALLFRTKLQVEVLTQYKSDPAVALLFDDSYYVSHQRHALSIGIKPELAAKITSAEQVLLLEKGVSPELVINFDRNNEYQAQAIKLLGYADPHGPADKGCRVTMPSMFGPVSSPCDAYKNYEYAVSRKTKLTKGYNVDYENAVYADSDSKLQALSSKISHCLKSGLFQEMICDCLAITVPKESSWQDTFCSVIGMKSLDGCYDLY